MFIPTKSAACNALKAFIPKAGRDYGKGRNYDNGPDSATTVSKLSPYIRVRLLPEWELLAAVLKQHSPEDASKFIDEVCWRTYWKGWLQLRPSIWENYLEESAALLQSDARNTNYLEAIEGRTGIDCFDAWANELVETNYLHNHARMWYASIWIHTLRLPWQLGANWFLRHLLDGDPASNTLSWRWVTGLQTHGKTYLARPDNIRKYTNGRFKGNALLASEPVRLESVPPPEPRPLTLIEKPPTHKRLGLLITEEDLSAADWIKDIYSINATVGYFPKKDYEALEVNPKVVDFRRKALSGLNRESIIEDVLSLVDWVREKELDCIVLSEPTTGHWPEILKTLKGTLKKYNIELFTVRHWWDQTMFPHARHGFFRFKKVIPSAIGRLPQTEALEICR